MADDYRDRLDFERYLQEMRRKIPPDEFARILRDYHGYDDFAASLAAVKKAVRRSEEMAEHDEAVKRMVKREDRWFWAWSVATMLGKWLIGVGGAVILFRDVLPIIWRAFGSAP